MSDEGSDGSPPRPVRRKIKKVMVLSSATESDSDESVVAASTRRKRLRVMSDDGNSSSSSGSSVVARRKRALPALRDSDAESDTSGWGSDRSDAPQPCPAATTTAKPSSGFASDSSEGNSDKCSICLLRFKEQEVGTPEACEHIFCLDCITEWSKNVNTCPVDRSTFNSIVVRTCAGGRVLRTEPVKVIERRSSVEVLVVEESTPCEVCGRTDEEETMLLCDGCDRGYHMQCLTPPLTEVPIDQWLCPNCDDLLDVIHLSELDDLFSGIEDLDLPEGPRMVPLRQPRNGRRSVRTHNGSDGPSTSQGSSNLDIAPSTSRETRMSRITNSNNSRTTVRRRTTGTKRRRYKRRTRTVIIEYEVEENGKFPVIKTVRRKLKKKKSRKRQPRTAARRSHVRASVQAKLQHLQLDARHELSQLASAGSGVRDLCVRRQRAGIPALSLFGNPHELDFFEEEDDVSEGGAAAVAVRPSASIFSAYRQARRKTLAIPSPPHASAAPDLLADILESQTLLHSKRSIVSVAVDGTVNIQPKPSRRPEGNKKGVNIVPDQRPVDNGNERVDVRKSGAEEAGRKVPMYPGQSGRSGGWGGGYRGGRVPPAAPGAHAYSGRGPPARPPSAPSREPPGEFSRYSPHYPPEPPYPRRNLNGRGGPSWRSAPLDMRTPPQYGPLPEPPMFKFDGSDEEAGSLVIDTEKYDPMEPTQDDSGDEAAPSDRTPPVSEPAPPAAYVAPLPPPPAAPPALQDALGGLGGLGVSAGALDSAVRAVLQEHHSLMVPQNDHSDDEDDGDCPNFSIYSAASVHIASNSSLEATPAVRSREDEYKEKISKRCPITPSTRNPIKIKLNTPSLIKRQVSLYDDEEPEEPATPPEDAPVSQEKPALNPNQEDEVPPEICENNVPDEPIAEKTTEKTPEIEDEIEDEKREETPEREATTSPVDDPDSEPEEPPSPEYAESPQSQEIATIEAQAETEHSEDEKEINSELGPKEADRSDETLEKMTESISETEDERSYTPCLDENKSKDTSLETDKDKGIEGLDTEMISEEEGNGIFSDEENRPPERVPSPSPTHSPTPSPTPSLPRPEEDKRKKKASKKEGNKRKTKKSDVAFKKLSKNGKERNYRDKDKDRNKRERRDSEAERKLKRKEKRKDLERYDVRNVVSEKRKRVKDAFGRDVSPRRSASAPHSGSGSVSPRRRRRSHSKKSPSPRRKSGTPRRRSPSPRRRSPTPMRRKSITPRRKSITPRRKSISPRRRSITPRRRSITPRRRSITPRRKSITPRRKSISPRRKSISPRRKSISPRRKPDRSPVRRRRSVSRGRKRRRSASPKPKTKKKKRVAEVVRRRSPRRKSAKRKRGKRSVSPVMGAAGGVGGGWSPASIDSRLLSPHVSPRTPLGPSPPRAPRAPRRVRRRSSGPSKEVFTSGDNILVSVSFKDQERDRDAGEKRKRREAKRDKRRKRRRAAAAAEPDAAKPVAIIDLERSPFRELTPSPKNVIVLSDSEHGEAEGEPPAPAPPEPADHAHVGPKTPPSPHAGAGPAAGAGAGAGGGAAPPDAEPRGPATPDSPDAYDPFEPTRSASASPSPSPSPAPAPAGGPAPGPAPAPAPAAGPAPPPSPPRTTMTLEAAQKTNMSADDVIDRRPISPIEKVMALLQSQRDVSPSPPPAGAAGPPPQPGPPPPAAAGPPAPRIVLPSPTRTQPPKLFLAKPSPIKSNPVKPMQATKISRLSLPLPLPRRDDPLLEPSSPYSPGSSDFGDLFSPPGGGGGGGGGRGKRDVFDALFDKPAKRRTRSAAKVPVKLNRKKGNKTQVGVKIDEDNLKILDDLPSSAVEMQVKSKFLKKLNRQERVVEEVKLVLKPHYNKKRVSKDEYKDILRRAVPKICHNKTGEINPAKIQALVEAYVKKFRKKHKLGLA